MKVDKDNIIAIKVSSFGDIEKIKKFNRIQTILAIIENGIIQKSSNDTIFKNVNFILFSLYRLVINLV